jgi:putative flippase GtrA
LIGAIGIGVQLSFLFLFKSELHINYLLATTLAVECAVVHNFLWHEHFTWSDRREGRAGMLRRLMRFNLTTGMISIVGNLLLMRLLVGALHLQYIVGNLLTIGVCSLANFWASDRMVFQQELTSKEW